MPCWNIKNIETIPLYGDLGVQSTSHAFEECLKEKGIPHSFNRKGTPYDNVCIESFYSSLKKEEINQNEYYDLKTARRVLFKSWYN